MVNNKWKLYKKNIEHTFNYFVKKNCNLQNVRTYYIYLKVTHYNLKISGQRKSQFFYKKFLTPHCYSTSVYTLSKVMTTSQNTITVKHWHLMPYIFSPLINFIQFIRPICKPQKPKIEYHSIFLSVFFLLFFLIVSLFSTMLIFCSFHVKQQENMSVSIVELHMSWRGVYDFD